jgi:hypothetical protein
MVLLSVRGPGPLSTAGIGDHSEGFASQASVYEGADCMTCSDANRMASVSSSLSLSGGSARAPTRLDLAGTSSARFKARLR